MTSFKVLVALRFFACGCYQTDAGEQKYLTVSHSSVSRAIHEVIGALNEPPIYNEWIRFPRNLRELTLLRNEFYRIHQFPGVVGCIDCTHVAIVPPKSDDPVYPEHIYVNRKNYHSINVQLICDPHLKFLNINSRYPGSTNDAFIWNNSNIKVLMENLHQQGHNNFYLLGDSGYPLRPWIMTPLEHNPVPGSPEERYNNAQKTTRSTVERCNGLLKMRFRCLLKHRTLHYSPIVASRIINACAVLHNMCVAFNVPEPEPEERDEDLDFGIIDGLYNNKALEEIADQGRINRDLLTARRMQRQLITNYFG